MTPGRIACVLMAGVLGAASAALAQPAPDDGKSTALSGVTVSVPRPTDMSGVTITGGCQIPPDSDHPSSMFDPAPWMKNQKTDPRVGTRDFIERLIAIYKGDGILYPKMTPGMTRIVKDQFYGVTQWVKCRGDLKSIKFLHVSLDGFDDYEVDFTNGAIEWEVAPLDAHQAVPESAIRYFYPQPETKTFKDLLKSLQEGRPNYAGLAPELASTLQAQWPTLQKALKDWGDLESVYFVRREDDGSYTYRVDFTHRRVIWKLAPLGAKSEIAGLTYADALAPATPAPSPGPRPRPRRRWWKPTCRAMERA